MRGRKVLCWIAGILVVAFVVIQFFPAERVNSAVTGEIEVSAGVRAVLRRACYDCHSNETVWPWYSRVAPVSWLVADDVEEARRHVNFSEWSRLEASAREGKLREIAEEIGEGEMPPWTYRLMHRGGRLSPEDKRVLASWCGTAPPGEHDEEGEEEEERDDD